EFADQSRRRHRLHGQRAHRLAQDGYHDRRRSGGLLARRALFQTPAANRRAPLDYRHQFRHVGPDVFEAVSLILAATTFLRSLAHFFVTLSTQSTDAQFSTDRTASWTSAQSTFSTCFHAPTLVGRTNTFFPSRNFLSICIARR